MVFATGNSKLIGTISISGVDVVISSIISGVEVTISSVEVGIEVVVSISIELPLVMLFVCIMGSKIIGQDFPSSEGTACFRPNQSTVPGSQEVS